jgi:hypothetical protein
VRHARSIDDSNQCLYSCFTKRPLLLSLYMQPVASGASMRSPFSEALTVREALSRLDLCGPVTLPLLRVLATAAAPYSREEVMETHALGDLS